MKGGCLRIFYAFARSGGTLLNKCLGSSARNVVLSEVSPAESVAPLEMQAREWFDLIAEDEVPEFAALGYAAQIQRLNQRCLERGRTLIVRDWPTINFLPGTYPDLVPSGVLEQELYLGGRFDEIRRLVLVRAADAVYESLTRSFPQFRKLEPLAFARAYVAYARAVREFPRIRVEDFSREPRHYGEESCRILDCEVDPDFTEKFAAYETCTGNNMLETPSSQSTTIFPVDDAPPPVHDPAARDLLDEADRLLGYAYA